MNEKGEYKLNMENRMTRVETTVDDIKDTLEKISTNHLPHIYDSVGDLKVKMAYYAGGVAVIVILAQAFIQAILNKL